MKTFEVVVRKIVTQAIVVEAESVEDANYEASCQASDGDCVEVLGIESTAEV